MADHVHQAPLPAPTTSRTPTPRHTSHMPRRVTRSRAAATQPDVPTARNPLHHSANPRTGRDPSSSLSPPPDGLGSVDLNPDGRYRTPVAESSRTANMRNIQMVSGLPNGMNINIAASQAEASSSATTAQPEVLPTTSPNRSQKRKATAPESDSEDALPLLSEYMCPICFSPPKSAIITPCGHILCGSCLHGATTTHAANYNNGETLCPVCRTPIPGLKFAMPEGRLQPSTVHRPRRVPPPSRTLPNGTGLPTRAEDMVDLDQVVDLEEDDSDDVLDASRSGVTGLELLTIQSL